MSGYTVTIKGPDMDGTYSGTIYAPNGEQLYTVFCQGRDDTLDRARKFAEWHAAGGSTEETVTL